MLRALVFDCGGVLVAPSTGDWVLGPGYEAILGKGFAEERLAEYRQIRAQHVDLLPDTRHIRLDAEEYELFIRYYEVILGEMGISLDSARLARLAYLQTYVDERYTLFGDVLPWLRQWHEEYALGIVSDAPPSTRRILSNMGVMAHMDAATFSCDLGILKPDPRIYQATLDSLGVLPSQALFIDDFPSRLRGAEAIGMRAVQMRRNMPALFTMPPVWEGPVVDSFAALDKLIRSMQSAFESK